MHSVVREEQLKVADLCRRHGVRRLDLFGSAAEDAFDPERSDLDFLVEFSSCSAPEHYDRYFGLAEDLEALFGRRVDLVEAGAMRNPYFIQGVVETRVCLYAA